MSLSLLLASNDEQFREAIRENLLNHPNAKLAAEYPEVASNLYVRVLQDLDRAPEAALIIDLSSGEPQEMLKVLEKVRQAAPDVYVIATGYNSESDTVLSAVRAGANDYLVLPLRRTDFRDALARWEKAPKRAAGGTSRLGRMYSFLGTKGGVGTTSLAVNFASVLAQRKQQTVLIDLDWTANDAAMQLGAQPQYTLQEVGENLGRMDQALFEGFVTRDALGFYLVGPPDTLEQQGYFTEAMLREFATFLVERYESIVVDAGRNLADEVVLGALQSSSAIFLVLSQEFPTIRNAQRYITYLMRMGFNQDQIKVVVNNYQKRNNPNYATLDQIQQTLNQPVFYGIPPSPAILPSINRSRPAVANREADPNFDKAFRAFVDKATGGKKAVAKSA